jgi:hypothetical protein
MVEVRPVIGDSHTHKTTTIRALTGVRKVEERWLIAYHPGASPLETFVHPAGLQELGIAPHTFVNRVAAAGVDQVIVALRHDPALGQPNAAAYLAAFVAAGWNVVAHAVLGRPVVIPGYVGIPVPNAASLPSNEIARLVRANWGIA